MRYQPEAWTDLSGVQRDICVLLAFDGPMTGREVTSGREVTREAETTTYRNLDHLVAEGVVRKTDKDDRARNYALTTDGAALVRQAVVETGVELAGTVTSEVRAGDA